MFFAFLLALVASENAKTELYSGTKDGVKHFYERNLETNEIKDLGEFKAFKRTSSERHLVGGSRLWTNTDHTDCIRTCIGCREDYPQREDNSVCLAKLK